jgi:plasmid maintenance system antidote protein VapI
VLYEPNQGLLALAGLGLICWFVLLGVVMTIRWPKTPRAGPETLDLGEESPAVASLLTSDFRLGRESISATLLDLAARGFVEIEDSGIGRYICRVKSRTEGSLTPYEELVLEHLTKLSREGYVPAEAMTTGTREGALDWWRKFRKEVISQAQSLGLSRDLLDWRTFVVFLVLGGLVYLLFETAIGFREIDEVESSPLLFADLMGFGLAVVTILSLKGSPWQRDTPAGRAAAARWLGLGRGLETNPSFGDIPPHGVVVWERHLAYAAGMGIAERAVASLPFGKENDHRAWSHYGGRWKQVHVRYPRLKPGWGRHPALTLAFALVLCALSLKALAALLPLHEVRATDIINDQTATAIDIAQLVAVAIAALVLVWWGLSAFFALSDLVSTREVTGEIIRLRAKTSLIPRPWAGEDNQNKIFYAALYDGQTDRVDAWRVRAKVYGTLYQHEVVKAVITPRVSYVRSAEQVAPSDPESG